MREAGNRPIARAPAEPDHRPSAEKTNKLRRVRWCIVKLVRILLGYAIAIPALAIALFGPLFWLVTPDPTLIVQPRAAPRIAESVVRERAAPLVQPERAAPAIAEPLPEMNEAPAALPKQPASVAPPKKQVSVAPPVRPVAKKRMVSARHPPPQRTGPPPRRTARAPAQWSSGPVTTARTDVPY